jgi:predicted acylesterase/phospholipase RssA
MKIDTLFLSGGGINCISFLGSLKYLIQKDLIKRDLSNIKTIIGVSGGILHIIPLLLGFSIDMTIKIFTNYDYNKLIDYNNFNINDLFTNFGFYSNDFIFNLLKPMFRIKNINYNITLKDFYKLTKIRLIMKTVNISKKEIIYLNYKNYPNLSLITAIQMTTCFPLFFKPIIFNDELYVDGGLCGNFPLEYKDKNRKKYKNYLGLNIVSNKEKQCFNDFFDYLSAIYNTGWSPYDHKINKRIIEIHTNGKGMDFNVTNEDKEKIIEIGYLKIKEIIDS